VDGAVGVLLHTTLDLERFAPQALSLVDGAALARSAVLWAAGAGAIPLAFGSASGRVLLPLLLRPALTLLALASLAAQPTYPYGFTLPVALTQDWGIAQDVATAAAMVAGVVFRRGESVGDQASASLPPHTPPPGAVGLRPPPPSWWLVPPPGAISMSFVAFVAYALLTPAWAYRWEFHPGNEPKTLRMAVAIGHRASLDVEPVSAAMERLHADFPRGAARSMAGAAVETGRMLAAVARGDAGRHAIRATRVTRQTVRGKEGGVYHVLAPGPSVLLAPALRLDRALNRREGREGRVAAAVVLTNALGALLVGALFALLRDATGRPWLSAAIAGAAAFVPPFLFYFFQFYPEMMGALVFAVALRWLMYRRYWSTRDAWLIGLLLATLPWLHQKFLPAWGVLAAWALVKLVAEMATARAALGLVLPQAATLFLFALYNFAITGSVRPDAVFLAWGPGGVSGQRVGQGLLGLVLDARYGIVPYVPFLLLAAGGLALPAARRLRAALPAMAIYYLTVAAADNWSGAVCHLGRYFMPAAPFALALAALAVARTWERPGVRAVVLTLAGWTAIAAWHLWLDPHAANDCAQLLAKSAIADGNVYIPNLFIRTWADAAPGLFARVAAWVAVAVLLAWWVQRAAAGRGGMSAARTLAAGFAVLLAFGFALERWPSGRGAASFPDAVEIAPGATAFGPRDGEVVVRSRQPMSSIRVRLSGEGPVRVAGVAPFVVSGAADVDLPLVEVAHLAGRRGVEEWLYRQEVDAGRGLTMEIVR
jgi:hypothetical protein